MAAKKTSGKTSPAKKPAKKAQARLVDGPRGGKLQVGNPGNAGGPGRPPSAIRETLRKSLDERIVILQGIIDDKEADIRDQIKAIELLMRYGLGAKDETEQSGEITINVVRKAASIAPQEDDSEDE